MLTLFSLSFQAKKKILCINEIFVYIVVIKGICIYQLNNEWKASFISILQIFPINKRSLYSIDLPHKKRTERRSKKWKGPSYQHNKRKAPTLEIIYNFKLCYSWNNNKQIGFLFECVCVCCLLRCRSYYVIANSRNRCWWF